MPGPQDGSYDFSEPFNPKDWAMYHERICATRWTSTDMKLGTIIKVGGWFGGAAFALVVALLGWSLKTNYDGLEAAHQTQNLAPAVAQAAADKASTETALKLGATNSTPAPQD